MADESGDSTERASHGANNERNGSQNASNSTHQKLKLVIAGAPACGKGTQCARLIEKYGVVHISTGEILRNAVREGTDLGVSAKEYLDRGELVPDDIMIGLVKQRLNEDDCVSRGWLLDGFPRTAAQADALVEANLSPDVVVVIDLADEVVVERATGRRLDPETGKIYHLVSNPPESHEIFERLVHRTDDTEEIVRARLRVYNETVGTTLSRFSSKVVRVEGAGAPDTVFEAVLAALEGAREALAEEVKAEEEKQPESAVEPEAVAPAQEQQVVVAPVVATEEPTAEPAAEPEATTTPAEAEEVQQEPASSPEETTPHTETAVVEEQKQEPVSAPEETAPTAEQTVVEEKEEPTPAPEATVAATESPAVEEDKQPVVAEEVSTAPETTTVVQEEKTEPEAKPAAVEEKQIAEETKNEATPTAVEEKPAAETKNEPATSSDDKPAAVVPAIVVEEKTTTAASTEEKQATAAETVEGAETNTTGVKRPPVSPAAAAAADAEISPEAVGYIAKRRKSNSEMPPGTAELLKAELKEAESKPESHTRAKSEMKAGKNIAALQGKLGAGFVPMGGPMGAKGPGGPGMSPKARKSEPTVEDKIAKPLDTHIAMEKPTVKKRRPPNLQSFTDKANEKHGEIDQPVVDAIGGDEPVAESKGTPKASGKAATPKAETKPATPKAETKPSTPKAQEKSPAKAESKDEEGGEAAAEKKKKKCIIS